MTNTGAPAADYPAAGAFISFFMIELLYIHSETAP
jgi:hypothetical protein